MSSEVAASDQPTELEFDLLRNAMYHSARRTFLERIDAFLNLLVLVLSSAAVISLGEEFPSLGKIFGVLVVIAGGCNLVFSFARRSSDEAVLAKRFFALRADLIECNASDEQRRIKAEMQRLYGEEGTILRALDAIMWNAAQASLYGDNARRIEVSRWQSLMRHFIPFHSDPFAPLSAPIMPTQDKG